MRANLANVKRMISMVLCTNTMPLEWQHGDIANSQTGNDNRLLCRVRSNNNTDVRALYLRYHCVEIANGLLEL
jgi:hypothetical protein